MNRLRALEAQLVRLEGAALVVIVLTMLGLAGYNVLYRNVFVPLQQHWAHSGPPVEDAAAPAKADESKAVDESKAESKAKAEAKPKGNAGGFAGGFGAGADDSGGDEFDEFDETPAEKEPAEDNAFAGGFGEGGDDEDEPEPAKAAPKKKTEGFQGGFGGGTEGEEEPEGGDDSGGESFGGGFGKPKPKSKDDAPDEEEDEEDDLFGEDDVFDNLAEIDAPDEGGDRGPQGGPPPEGSFAANMVELIDAIKLDWIDVLLRQLVIVMSFLGGALATARRKHINIDAASKLLPKWAGRWASVLTNLLAIGVCLTLANAGQSLVAISKEYAKEITPFADDWMFQLMFPIGFGLIATHFGVRLLEALTGTEPIVTAAEGAAAAKIAAAEAEVAADAPADDDADEEEADAKSVAEEDASPEEEASDEEEEASDEEYEAAPADAEDDPPDEATSSKEEEDKR